MGLLDKDVLTTGEVAKVCNVAPRTVSKWFDSGQIEGYRIPGSKDRRIPVAQLLQFMKAHGIPMDGMHSGKPRILVVDEDSSVTDALSSVLTEQANYEVKTVASGFQAGFECERFRPHVLLLDLHIAGDSGVAANIPGFLHSTDELAMVRVIAMSGKLTDGQSMGLRAQGFDGFLKKPFAVRQVITEIEKVHSLVS